MFRFQTLSPIKNSGIPGIPYHSLMFLIALHVNFMCFISVPSEPTAPESETLVAFQTRYQWCFLRFSFPSLIVSLQKYTQDDMISVTTISQEKKHCFFLSVGHMACKVERKRFETPCSKWRSSSSSASSYNNNNNNQIPASLYNLHQATICCLPFLHPTVSLYQVSLNNTRGHLSFLQDHLCEHWHVFH